MRDEIAALLPAETERVIPAAAGCSISLITGVIGCHDSLVATHQRWVRLALCHICLVPIVYTILELF
jgi:hypothetical protein